MLLSSLKVSAEFPFPPLSAGWLSAPIHKAVVCLTRGHNLGVRRRCSLTLIPSPTDPSLILCCHLSSAVFTTGSQAIRPPPYLSFTSLLLPIYSSINPSVHPFSPPHFPIPLFSTLSIHHFPSSLIHPYISLT